MGFFDDIFGDPVKQHQKEIERWKEEDRRFMEEVRRDDRRWRQAGGDPELYDEIKKTEEMEEEFRQSMRNLDRRRKSDMAALAMSDKLGSFANSARNFADRQYSRAMKRDADKLVRDLEEESRRYD